MARITGTAIFPAPESLTEEEWARPEWPVRVQLDGYQFLELVRDQRLSALGPSAPTPERRFMKIPEFAGRHGYSVSTIKKWLRLGLPTNGIFGRGVRIKVADGDAWVEAGGPQLALRAAGARHARKGSS